LPENEKEVAEVFTLSAGPYTFLMTGPEGEQANALFEIFEIDWLEKVQQVVNAPLSLLAVSSTEEIVVIQFMVEII